MVGYVFYSFFLGEAGGLGSAAWITPLQLKTTANKRINFFVGRLVTYSGKGNALDAKGAPTSIHAPFAALGR